MVAEETKPWGWPLVRVRRREEEVLEEQVPTTAEEAEQALSEALSASDTA